MRLLHENTISDSSGLVLLRSKIRAVTRRMKFDESKMTYAELVGTEIFTNQQKYVGKGGLIQIWETNFPHKAMELFAIDYGPGIENVEEAVEDGFSTAKTMGKGLGSIKRLSDEYEIFSMPEKLVDGANKMYTEWKMFPGSQEFSWKRQKSQYPPCLPLPLHLHRF